MFRLQVKLCYNKHRWLADEKIDLEPRKQNLAVSKDSHYENINKSDTLTKRFKSKQ